MLNSQEILDLLKCTPQGFLKPEDNLFNVSNLHILRSYKKLGAVSGDVYETLNDLTGSALSNSANEIFCNVMGCSKFFDSVSSYQSHYNAMHRFICSECKKSLPTAHLLDLHLSEQHDSYFNVRVERGNRLFKCYLEECKEIFQSPMERKEHCIKQHKLPSNFRFNKVSHKNTQSKIKKSEEATSPQECIKVVGQKHLNLKNQGLKTFSFGHQKEKTFLSRNVPKQKQSGETLENMDSLKEALNSM